MIKNCYGLVLAVLWKAEDGTPTKSLLVVRTADYDSLDQLYRTAARRESALEAGFPVVLHSHVLIDRDRLLAVGRWIRTQTVPIGIQFSLPPTSGDAMQTYLKRIIEKLKHGPLTDASAVSLAIWESTTEAERQMVAHELATEIVG